MEAESTKQTNNISPIMRTVLVEMYIDWLNNYTINTFAEHHQLTYKQSLDLLTIASDIYNTVAPDA